MMTEHLNFEDIVDAIYADEMTPDNMRLIHRVQAHVMKCDSCRHIYDTIQTIRDWREDELSDEKFAAASFPELLKSAAVSLSVSISNGCRLALDGIQQLASGLDYSFEHPLALATRNGAGDEDMSRLVDEENDYNRLTLDGNKLTVSLDAEDWGSDIPVLIAADADKNVYFCDEMKLLDGRYTAVVAVPNDGTYDIMIGKTDKENE